MIEYDPRFNGDAGARPWRDPRFPWPAQTPPAAPILPYDLSALQPPTASRPPQTGPMQASGSAPAPSSHDPLIASQVLPNSDPMSLEPGPWFGRSYRTVNDPALRGTNTLIRSMIADHRDTSSIVAALNRVRPKFGDGLAAQIAPTVGFRAAHENVPMQNYDIDVERMRAPMSRWGGFINHAAQSGPGAFLISAGDGLAMDRLADLTPNPAQSRLGMGLVQGQHPVMSALGYGYADWLENKLAGGSAELLAKSKALKNVKTLKELGDWAPTAGTSALSAAKGWADDGPKGALTGMLQNLGLTGFAKTMSPDVPDWFLDGSEAAADGVVALAEKQNPETDDADRPPPPRPVQKPGLFAAPRRRR